MPREIPAQITKQLNNWLLCFWSWNILHYVLGLWATVGAVVLAAKIEVPNKDWLAITVAIATAALTFLKASAKANAYIAAWRYLNAERICFELDAKYDEAKLCDAHKKGEQIIGKVD